MSDIPRIPTNPWTGARLGLGERLRIPPILCGTDCTRSVRFAVVSKSSEDETLAGAPRSYFEPRMLWPKLKTVPYHRLQNPLRRSHRLMRGYLLILKNREGQFHVQATESSSSSAKL